MRSYCVLWNGSCNLSRKKVNDYFEQKPKMKGIKRFMRRLMKCRARRDTSRLVYGFNSMRMIVLVFFTVFDSLVIYVCVIRSYYHVDKLLVKRCQTPDAVLVFFSVYC